MTDLIEEQGVVLVDCGFCKQHYELDQVDVAQFFAPGTTHGSSGTTH